MSADASQTIVDVPSPNGADTRRRLRRQKAVGWLLTGWIFLVCLFFLWEADRYAGFYAWLAEWQFDVFGRYLPVLTYALLVIAFGWPASWLLRRRRRLERPGIFGAGQEAGVYVGSRFRRALFAFAWALAGAALVTLLWSLTLPRLAAPRTTLEVGDTLARAPEDGPIALRGQVLYARTAAFSQDVLFSTHGVRFAPIVGPGEADPRLRYFVELLPEETGAVREVPELSTRSGVLLENRLPGSIVRLYRYAGFVVERPVYVLYASERSIRWPYIVTAVQLAIAALVALVAALFQHRHVRRVTARPDLVEGGAGEVSRTA